MDNRGQSLLETALLFPLITLVLVGLVQMILLARTELKLGQTASEIAYQLSTHSLSQGGLPLALAEHFGLDLGWGFPDPAASSTQKQTLPSWRRYPGIGTLGESGQLASVQLTYRFYPRFLFQSLQTIHSSTELLIQPAVPGDPS